MERGNGACEVFVVVVRHVAANRNSRSRVEQRRYGASDIAADVLKVNVYAVWAGSFELLREVPCFVVDALIETEFFFYIAAFIRTARDTHCSQPLELRYLP